MSFSEENDYESQFCMWQYSEAKLFLDKVNQKLDAKDFYYIVLIGMLKTKWFW